MRIYLEPNDLSFNCWYDKMKSGRDNWFDFGDTIYIIQWWEALDGKTWCRIKEGNMIEHNAEWLQGVKFKTKRDAKFYILKKEYWKVSKNNKEMRS